jgi:hypothetical protein
VDRYLRKRAQLSGKSLNQIILEDLAAHSGEPLNITAKKKTLADELAWFIGSGIDDQTLQALAKEDSKQKQLMAQEFGIDS